MLLKVNIIGLIIALMFIHPVFAIDQIFDRSLIRNECVVLLHGLARSSSSFTKMEKALTAEDYTVVNVAYPSRHHAIEVLANQYVGSAIKQCHSHQLKRIHFVTHSMGGISIRYYLANHKLSSLGRIVMLSPPNKGSEIVDKLGDFPGFHALNGPAGQQLGASKESLPNRLKPIDYPVGIITGNRSINLILSLLIPGDDDGKVSIQNAKLAGMTDFLVVPHIHPMIMRSEEVIRQSMYFLQHALFDKRK